MGHDEELPVLEDTDEIHCEIRLPGTSYRNTLVRTLSVAKNGGLWVSGNSQWPFLFLMVHLLLFNTNRM